LIIQTKSYPRAALLGNPSDGYFGKTIAFPFRNFSARVTLYETPELEIIPADYDSNIFGSIRDLSEDVDFYGYYGGIRLLKAAVKRFYQYCLIRNHSVHNKNFTIRYSSDIPYRLGLAGSSAIITACIRALMRFYDVEITSHELANLSLSVETEELKISAGLQDRVVQAFDCPVYMDFDQVLMEERGYGIYEPMNSKLFNNIYIAYHTDLSEGSEIVHDNFRERYNFGVEEVNNAIRQWSDITVEGKDHLQSGNIEKLNTLINTNFDIRHSVMNISRKNIQMVEMARSVGASAKFTGSGGAIIGLYRDQEMYTKLQSTLQAQNITVLKPLIK
jgi:glucuronokinase